jgi:hypothetical protein
MYNDGSMSRANGSCPLTTISVGALTMAANNSTKRCTKCGEVKPLVAFQINDPKGYRKSRCKPCFQKYHAAWCAKNKERVRGHKNKWSMANKEQFDAIRKAWSDNNKEKVMERTRRYQAAKLSAWPKWANKAAMWMFYQSAIDATKTTGKPHEVDHIVPLISPLVCGLHCEFNLKVLPRFNNRSKANRTWPDMPEVCYVDEGTAWFRGKRV